MKKLLLLTIIFSGCGEGQSGEEEISTQLDAQISGMLSRSDLRPNDYVEVSNNVTLLGEKLFLDANLSGNQDISCSTCHSLVNSGDELSLPIGTGGIGLGISRIQNTGKVVRRNSSPLYNLGQSQQFSFHDGRVSLTNGIYSTPASLSSSITSVFDKVIDAQALFPILSNDEMRGQSGENALANISDEETALNTLLSTRILSDISYVSAFQAAYPGISNFTPGHIGNAIGSFIKNKFNVRDTPYDQYLNGSTSAISISQKRGLQIFLGKGQCIRCHSGVNLSDDDFHSVGVPHVFPSVSAVADDLGRYEVTNVLNDRYRFKTPGLRNVSKTSPYMHNGTFSTLTEVIDHYNNIGFSLFNYSLVRLSTANYTESILIDSNSFRNNLRFNNIDNGALKRGLNLNTTEKEDLKNFLESLSD